MSQIDIFSIKTVHLVGIKGVAMAALAEIFDDMGIQVTGSDIEEDFVTSWILKQRGFVVATNFQDSNIPQSCDLVVYTGAHNGRNNPEVIAARARGIPTMTHAQALGEVMAGKRIISVCGTGGKSTTTAMIAWILEYAGLAPSFADGVGKINNFGTAGRYKTFVSDRTNEVSRSGWFVAEADEYAVDPTSDKRPRFIYQSPITTVCSNLTFDHPDIYSDLEHMKQTFLEFFTQESVEHIFVNGDCEALVQLAKQAVAQGKRAILVGTTPNAMFQITNYRIEQQLAKCTIIVNGTTNQTTQFALELPFPGIHVAIDAVLAICAVNASGVDVTTACRALAQFTGTTRRFEWRGERSGAHLYDDYAHTPQELTATLTALKQWEPNRKILAIFQPHTYSRTKALFEQFVQSLATADEIILLDIFASAREQVDTSVSSALLAEAIKKIQPNSAVEVVPTTRDLAKILPAKLTNKKTCITLGAGDVYTVYDKLQ